MPSKSSPKKVLIAASGTGGHLFPAVYIAEELKKLNPEMEIEFCGAGRPLEEKIVGSRGYGLHVIPIVGVARRGLKGLLQFAFQLPVAFFKTLKLLLAFRPDLVIGVGGYVTVLPVVLARILGKKTLIHEAEVQPGMANQFLSKWADCATVASGETKFKSKIKVVHTGQPINPQLFNMPKANPQTKNLLILGGSQGARGIDQALIESAAALAEHSVRVFHQCRKESLEKLEVAYKNAGVEA